MIKIDHQKLLVAFARFAEDPVARNGYDANVEVDPEIFFP